MDPMKPADEPLDELVCCNEKFKNCPTVKREGDTITITGDDGQQVPFDLDQFMVLLQQGHRVMPRKK